MSADNGIYVMRTAGPEFRVAHAQAIETLWTEYDSSNDIDDMPTTWIPDYKMIVDLYKDSPVHTTIEDALNAAQKLHDEYGWTEYGISVITDFANLSFAQIEEEAKHGKDIGG